MAEQNLYDAVIVGGGPAGLTAALYLARARYRVLVVEKSRFGGQITITEEVVNYPGVEKTSGEALTETIRRQAENFGAEFLLAEVTDLKLDGDIKSVITTRGELQCFALLIATGANPRMVGFNGEQEFRGRGVAYCATCDGELFTGKELLVIGGGFAAAEEAMFLTRYASKITMLVRKDSFSCAKSIVEELFNHPKIEVLFHHELKSVSGSGNGIDAAVIVNNQTKEEKTYKSQDGGTFGVFVFAGYVPNTVLVKDKIELTKDGYAVTDNNMATSVPGVFAAGDLRVKTLRQVVTATADGALAAASMEKLAKTMREKTGLEPKVPEIRHAHEAKPENAPARSAAGGFISEDMLPQLEAVFDRMQSSLTLEVHGDGGAKGAELLAAMQDLAKLTDKLDVTEVSGGEHLPCVRLKKDGVDLGIAFHGVPGGHEFTSFVLALYNAAGPGQSVDQETLRKALAIDKTVNLKILVSLSCTMCPDLVTAAQRLAALNHNVTAEVYDLNLYPDLRDKFHVMSVPCLVVNDKDASFGRKNLDELLAYIDSLN